MTRRLHRLLREGELRSFESARRLFSTSQDDSTRRAGTLDAKAEAEHFVQESRAQPQTARTRASAQEDTDLRKRVWESARRERHWESFFRRRLREKDSRCLYGRLPGATFVALGQHRDLVDRSELGHGVGIARSEHGTHHVQR